MSKRPKSMSNPPTLAKVDNPQEHTTMDQNHSSAENQLIDETTTEPQSNQHHIQIEKEAKKGTPGYTITKTPATIHTNNETTVNKKHTIESIEDLERRLADSRRFADEMEETLRRLIERNRKIVGLGHDELP